MKARAPLSRSFSAAPADSPALRLHAADAYAAALSDGLLLFRLSLGSPVWAPDGDLLEQQPALLLTTLLHGGTYLHGVSLSELAPRDPAGTTCPFVRRVLRDRMLDQAPRTLPGLRLWVVHPTEAADARWLDWIEHQGLRSVPAISAWVDSSAGGCTLFSAPQLGGVPQRIPAGPWAVLFVSGGGLSASTGGLGLWRAARSPHDADALGVRLATQDAAFVYGGTAEVLHHDQRVCTQEVEACVAQLPFVDAAVVLEQAGDRSAPILFVFLGPEPLAIAQDLSAARCGAIREQLVTRLGPGFVPPQIETLAMYPRRRGGSVDRAWLRQLYDEGGLREREQHGVFRLLDQLRSAWFWSATARPTSPGPSRRVDD